MSDDNWQAALLELFARLDHAETLHEDTMRFQVVYATEDIGAFVAAHRSQLAAALAKVAELQKLQHEIFLAAMTSEDARDFNLWVIDLAEKTKDV